MKQINAEEILEILKSHLEPLQIGNVPYSYVIHSGKLDTIAHFISEEYAQQPPAIS